jgi:hypothetical protein
MKRISKKSVQKKSAGRPKAGRPKRAVSNSKPHWFFARNDGGEDKGLNDAGVVTFKGDIYESIAREVIQNSLDARLSFDVPVRVVFRFDRVERKSIPAMDELCEVCQRCRKFFWPRNPEKDFFNRAVVLTERESVDVLTISDFNTKGVEGGDYDRTRDRGWYSLVRCIGSSAKEAGEGGSYGLGKSAPFAASDLRTVLYSTMTVKKSCAFVGVARLVTHEKSSRHKFQNTGFLGGPKGESLRTLGTIPKQFRREVPGTDVVILGFRTTEDWESRLLKSVLENFWPAIHFRDLEVEINGMPVSASNLPELLASDQNDVGEARLYYDAFVSGRSRHFTQDLPSLGTVDLFIDLTDDGLKKVAMVRKSGMVIWQRAFRSIVPFTGVFLCRNDDGNRILRSMEPPKHDSWDGNLPEVGQNKHIVREFTDFIRSTVRELTGSIGSTVVDFGDLSQYLPDDETFGDPGASAAAESDSGDAEGFPDAPRQPAEQLPLPVSRHPKRRHDSVVPAEDEGPEEVVKPEQATEGEPQRDGEGDGDEIEDPNPKSSSIDEEGQPRNGKTAVEIRLRTVPRIGDFRSYMFIVRSVSSVTQKVFLTLEVVGDEGRQPLRLEDVALTDGSPVAFTGTVIGPIAVSSNPVRLNVRFTEPSQAAFGAIAYEAN